MKIRKPMPVLKTVARIVLGPVIAAVVVFSLIPEPVPAPSVPHLDKLAHFAVYALIGSLIVSAFMNNRKRALLLAAAVAFCALLGLSLEFLQSFTARTPDVFDELCNISGGLAGGGLALLAARFWMKDQARRRT